MAADDPKTLVSTDWLAARLDDPDIRVLDGSYYLPAMKRDARGEFNAGHIPGAQFFDIDDISDHRSSLPHMAPPPEKFISRVRALGIGDGNQVVVYDGAGLFSAARVWWLFRLMGQENIAVLDGGLPKWQAEGKPVTNKPSAVRDRHLTATRQPHLVKDVTQVAAASKLGDWQIVDARAGNRFRGEVPEPREGLRPGRIPGSINVPFNHLLHSDGTMKEGARLAQVFTAAGVDLNSRVITTCGSGVTAAVLMLGLERLGHKEAALYDGSWSEWGQFEQLRVEVG